MKRKYVSRRYSRFNRRYRTRKSIVSKAKMILKRKSYRFKRKVKGKRKQMALVKNINKNPEFNRYHTNRYTFSDYPVTIGGS